MQPLGTVELYLNVFIAIWFPLLIVVNLRSWGARSPLNAYLWREEPNLMRVSLVVIGLLTAFTYARLAAHFGLLAGSVLNVIMLVTGVPFLVAAIAEIWLGTRALRRYLRARPGHAGP